MTSSLFAFTRNILIRVTERDRDKNEKESVYNKSDDYHGCMSDFFIVILITFVSCYYVDVCIKKEAKAQKIDMNGRN